VSGNVGIGPGSGGNNDLSLSLGSDVLHSLKHGDAFQLISFNGDIGNVNATNPLNPIPDLAVAPLFTDIGYISELSANNGYLPSRIAIQFANNGVYAVFLNPRWLAPAACAIAPDFNGDGVVDLPTSRFGRHTSGKCRAPRAGRRCRRRWRRRWERLPQVAAQRRQADAVDGRPESGKPA